MKGEATRPTGRHGLWLTLICLVTFAVYARTLANDFTYDDRHYARIQTMHGPNPMVRELRPLEEYFSKPMGYGVAPNARGFRPVTVLSYALVHHAFRMRLPEAVRDPDSGEMEAWSDSPVPHHVLNLLLHLFGVVLVYRLACLFSGPGIGSLLAAAVFALHSLRSDVVCSIVGRGELLPFVFGGLALLFYLKALDSRGRSLALHTVLVFVFALLACLAKESALAWLAFMPVTALALCWARGQAALSPKYLRRQLLPFCLALLPAAAVFVLLWIPVLRSTEHAFDVAGVANPLYRSTFDERFPSAVMILGYGLYKVLWPFSLASDYGMQVFDLARTWTDFRFLAATFCLLLILVSGLMVARRHPLLFLAMASFLGFSFITSNIVEPIETIFAERLYYTPALCLSFLVAWSAERLAGCGRRVLLWLLGLWLLVCAGLCVKRSFDWQDNDTLFLTDAAGQPRSVSMHTNAARIYRLRGDKVKWKHEIRTVLELDPENSVALNDMGLQLREAGKPEAAEKYFRRGIEALRQRPMEQKRDLVYLHLHLAGTLETLGRLDAALKEYRTTLATDPSCVPARLRLIWHAFETGDLDMAKGLLAAGESLGPKQLDYALFRGLFSYRQGDYPGCIQQLDPILRSLPPNEDRVPVYLALIDSYGRVGRPQDALRLLEACLSVPGMPPAVLARFEKLRRALQR